MRKIAFRAGFILAMTCSLLTAAEDQVPEAKRNATFTVALNGRDSNPGTFEKPFATLARARDAVRKMRETATTSIKVYVPQAPII